MINTFDSETKDVLSDFNEAKFQILRLNYLWQSCNSMSTSGRLDKWKWHLDAIWRELSPDAYKKDKSYFNLIKELNESIKNHTNQEEFYDALSNKESFLRMLQDEVGKGARWRKTDEDDLD